MQDEPIRGTALRWALHRFTVATLSASLEGQQRRSTWMIEQARLLGTPDDIAPGAGVIGMVPSPRRGS